MSIIFMIEHLIQWPVFVWHSLIVCYSGVAVMCCLGLLQSLNHGAFLNGYCSCNHGENSRLLWCYKEAFWNPILQCFEVLGVSWGQSRDFPPPFSKLKNKKKLIGYSFHASLSCVTKHLSTQITLLWVLSDLNNTRSLLAVFLATPNHHSFLCFKLWSTPWTISVLFSVQRPCHYLKDWFNRVLLS